MHAFSTSDTQIDQFPITKNQFQAMAANCGCDVAQETLLEVRKEERTACAVQQDRGQEQKQSGNQRATARVAGCRVKKVGRV